MQLMPEEQLRRQQHLVSKGYQRNFSDGNCVSILDVTTGTVLRARRSIERNWRVPDFVSVVTSEGGVDDSLEREFAKDERVILNVIREISPSSAKVTDRQKDALDKLAVIHLVRSLSFASTHEAVVKNWLTDGAIDLATDPTAIALFTRDKGRPPVPGELEAIVAASAQTFAARPDLLAGGMRHGTQTIPEILAKSSIQLISGDESLPGFVLPDHPILHGKRDKGLFGFRYAGAVGDADLIVAPIHRRLVAFYSRRRLRNVEIKTKKGISVVNALLMRSAASEVACHPADALATSQLIRNLDRFPAAEFDSFRIR
jgi:Protein of unknown function (DUF4238)